MIFAKFVLGATGRSTINLNAVADSATLNGAAYMNDAQAVFADTGAVAATDGIIGGFRYTTAGALRVYDATAGLPANTHVNQGIALTTDGQVCYNTAVNTVYTNLNGVALDNSDRVFVNVLSFQLPFADLGAGVVDTTETISGATPTFTRATSAWTTLSDGTIGLVASGSPRSCYSPSGTYLGYLAESASTNLVVQSQDFSATWSAVGTPTISSGTTTLGALSLDTIGDNSAAALEGYSEVVGFTGNAVKAISIFVKKGTSASSIVRVRDTTAGADRLLMAITWSADTPVVTATTGTDLTGTPEQFGSSGVYRLMFATSTVTAASTNQIEVYPATDAALDVAATGTIQWGGVQAENAAFSSSYIVTTVAAVVRNADVLTYPSAGNVSSTTGTFYFECAHYAFAPAGLDFAALSINDTTINERLLLYINNIKQSAFAVEDGGSLLVNMANAAGTIGVIRKVSASYSLNNFALTQDGGTISTDTSGTLPTVTIISVGLDATGGILPLNGILRNVRIWQSQMPNAELQAVTS